MPLEYRMKPCGWGLGIPSIFTLLKYLINQTEYQTEYSTYVHTTEVCCLGRCR